MSQTTPWIEALYKFGPAACEGVLAALVVARGDRRVAPPEPAVPSTWRARPTGEQGAPDPGPGASASHTTRPSSLTTEQRAPTPPLTTIELKLNDIVPPWASGSILTPRNPASSPQPLPQTQPQTQVQAQPRASTLSPAAPSASVAKQPAAASAGTCTGAEVAGIAASCTSASGTRTAPMAQTELSGALVVGTTSMAQTDGPEPSIVGGTPSRMAAVEAGTAGPASVTPANDAAPPATAPAPTPQLDLDFSPRPPPKPSPPEPDPPQPTTPSAAEVDVMLGAVVRLLTEVVGETVRHSVDAAVERVEQAHARERDALVERFEAALERQETRLREVLDHQARQHAEDLRVILRDVLAQRPAPEASPPTVPTEVLEEFQETLRQGFGEVRGALERHHHSLMNVVRAELQPLAQAALTHLKRPEAPKPSTPEESSAPATPPSRASPSRAPPIRDEHTSSRLRAAIGDEDDDDIDDIEDLEDHEDPHRRPLHRRRSDDDDDTERSHHQEASP